MNYQKYTEPAGGTMTSSSQAGSRNRASHTALQEKGSVKKMNATCGRTCLEQYEKLSQSTWWGKMFGELLVGTGDWYSTRCKLTWKLKVTPSSRAYFQLAVSTLPIEENEFGLLPTATASDYKMRGPNSKQQGLPEAARAGLLPTPIASDIHHAERVQKLKESGAETMASRKLGANRPNRPNGIIDYLDFNGMLLPTPRVSGTESYDSRAARKGHDVAMSYLESNIEFQVRNGMLPTPLSSDCGEKVTGLESQDSLTKRARNLTGQTSQLNDQFVCEMMGFPINYLSLW